jgi:hypothetical protein
MLGAGAQSVRAGRATGQRPFGQSAEAKPQSTQASAALHRGELGRVLLYTGIALMLCLLAFIVAVVEASSKNKDFEVLLFFLPWSPLLKQQVGEISFFTIALIIVCVVALVKRRFSVRRYQILIPALLLTTTLLAKMIQGFSLDKSYLLFFAMLVLFPCVVTKDLGRQESFPAVSLFFAVGIISAALSAQAVAGYANIAQFITVNSWAHVTRLAGYYGDPNFYSAQIDACIACLLVLLAKESSVGFRIGTLAALVALLYCGLLAASKSFVIVGACELCIWVLLMLSRKGKKLGTYSLLIAAVAVLLFVLSTSAFQNLLAILGNRFSYSASASQITTGRTDIWANYLNLLTHDPKLALFGEGYTSVLLDALYDRASHNTLIQCIYQFGAIGTPLLIAWVVCLFKSALSRFPDKLDGMAFALMLIGVFLPWLGLDYLFFDDFFLLPWLVMKGTVYFSNTGPEEIPMRSGQERGRRSPALRIAHSSEIK